MNVEPIEEEILRIVYAFGDPVRKEGIRDIARRVARLRTLAETQARELAEAKAKLAVYERATAVEFSRGANVIAARALFTDDNDPKNWWVQHPNIGCGGEDCLTRDEAIAKAAALAAEKKT